MINDFILMEQDAEHKWVNTNIWGWKWSWISLGIISIGFLFLIFVGPKKEVADSQHGIEETEILDSTLIE